MGQQLAVCVSAAALAGCSLIYNPGGLPGPNDGMEVIVDADPSMLALMDVKPAVINEGQGAGGGRSAVIVIRGENIAPDAMVTITSQTNNNHFTVGAVELAADHKFIAVQIVATVDDTLAPGSNNNLDIHVTQTIPAVGTITKDLIGMVAIKGLRTLDTFNGDASTLDELYSDVKLSGAITLSGNKDQRATIRSASSIMVGNLDASGKSAQNKTPGDGGPGGCKGGAPGGNGDCSPGAGQAGGMGGGGGGASFGGDGTPGGGNNPGSAGMKVGNATISTYDDFMGITANRAGGGGGGGGGAVLTAGGAGGGGGGIVELTAEGDIMAGTITANGGTGSRGTTTLTDGGGGGGAGGAILVRAGGTLATGMLTAKGAGSMDTGGTGSVGRIRFDVATGTPPAGDPVPHRGPAFAGAPVTVTTPNPSIMLTGSSNDGFKVYVIDHDGASHDQDTYAFGSNGTVTITPTLFRGYNRLCILLDGGARGTPEGEKCIDIAMLP